MNYTNTVQLQSWLRKDGYDNLADQPMLVVDEREYRIHMTLLGMNGCPEHELKDRAAFRCLTQDRPNKVLVADVPQCQFKAMPVFDDSGIIKRIGLLESNQYADFVSVRSMLITQEQSSRYWRYVFVIISVLLALLLLATRAHAQQHDYLGHSVLVGSSMLEIATTRVALHNGAHEIGSAGVGLGAQIAVKVGFIAVIEGLSTAAARDGHPTLAHRNRLLWSAGMIGLSLWNGHVIAEQHRYHQRRIH